MIWSQLSEKIMIYKINMSELFKKIRKSLLPEKPDDYK